MKIFLHNCDTQLGIALYEELKLHDGPGNKIYGTLLADSDPSFPEILPFSEYVNIVKKSNSKLVLRTSLQCDLSVIPLMSMSDAEINDIIGAIHSRTLGNDTVVVLLSSFESWAATQADTVRPEDFSTRVPSKDHGLRYKRIEDAFLALKNPRVKVKIVTCGRIYGFGEFEFAQIFKNAWQGLPFNVPPAPKFSPLVHALDVAKITRNFFPSESGPFCFAFDASTITYPDFVSEIFGNFSSPALITSGAEEETKIVKFEMPEDFPWFSKQINFDLVCAEFCEKRRCRPTRILLYGAEVSLAQNLAGFYGLPLFNKAIEHTRESTFRGFVISFPNLSVEEAKKIFSEENDEGPKLRETVKPHTVLEISENFAENSQAEQVSQFFRNFNYDVPVLDFARPKIFNVARTFIERQGVPVSFLPPAVSSTPSAVSSPLAHPREDVENDILNAAEKHEAARSELKKIDLKNYLGFCIPALADAVGKFSEISTDDPLSLIADCIDEIAENIN